MYIYRNDTDLGRSLGIYESTHHGSLYMHNKKGGCPWTIGDLSTRFVAVVFIGGFSKYPKKRLKRISYLSSFNDMFFFLMGGFNPLKSMTIISANHLKYGFPKQRNHQPVFLSWVPASSN